MSEELSARIDSLARDFQRLQEDATFSEELDEMVDLESDIEELRPKLEQLRKNGYKYKNFLEKKVDNLASKWKKAKPKSEAALRMSVRSARPILDDLLEELTALQKRPSKGKTDAFETKLRSAEERIEGLEAQIETTYDNISQTYYQTGRQIDDLLWSVEQLQDATFKLKADESLIQASKAVWQISKDKDDNPEGILYLTDQRLLFEQKEKVATKKILFIATEKELVHELKLETPITSIEEMKRHNEGLFRMEEHLDLVLGKGAPFASADFEIKGFKSEEWIAVINHTLSGAIAHEVFGQSAEGSNPLLEVKLADAPTRCDACGAPVPTLSQAQRQHQCEYCGSVMRW